MEIRPIPGESGYYARADGAIFSDRQGGQMKQLSTSLVRGYLSTSLMRPGKKVGTRAYVHILMCTTYHGLSPFEGAQVRHLNSDKMDCSEGNLCWGTRVEQFADRVADGTDNRGEKNGRNLSRRLSEDPEVVPLGAPASCARSHVSVGGSKPRLTGAQVARMRQLEAAGANHVELGVLFSVHPGYVSQLCRGAVRADATGAFRPNRNQKVTPSQVAEMKRQKDSGERTVVSLAAEYGLSREHAGRLLR